MMFVKFDNGIYFGSVNKTYQREGLGIWCEYNGTIYCGGWKNDLFSNFGRILYSNGDHYIGSFKNGYINGYGTKYFKSKSKYYSGEWKNNKKHGLGKIYYKNSLLFEGIWKRNKKQGNGIEYSKNSVKKGLYVNDKKQNYFEVISLKNKKSYNVFYEQGNVYKINWKKKKLIEGLNGGSIKTQNFQTKRVSYTIDQLNKKFDRLNNKKKQSIINKNNTNFFVNENVESKNQRIILPNIFYS